MKTSKTRLILAIASAYAALPGCGDDSEPPEELPSFDGGVIARPPNDGGPDAARSLDAGILSIPPKDAGCTSDASTDGGCREKP